MHVAVRAEYQPRIALGPDVPDLGRGLGEEVFGPSRRTVAVVETSPPIVRSRVGAFAFVPTVLTRCASSAGSWPRKAAACHLAAALTGHRVHWVLGARFTPRGAHAWVVADGHVIGQDETDRLWPYLPVLTVGNSNG